MFFRVLKKDQIPTFIEGLAVDYEVIAPIAKGLAYVFAPVTCGARVVLDYPTTIVPPTAYFLKPKEALLRYNSADGEVVETVKDDRKRILFGVHPCDLNAILMTDKVFLGDYEDPYYKARRESTLIVGVSCTPRQSCVCHMFGANEVLQGYDLYLTDIGDAYFVQCSSVEGAQLLDTLVETREATAEDTRALQKHVARFRQTLGEAPDTTQIPLLFDARYDEELWEEIGSRCLSCGACSAVCPTCYCFDIVDELDANGVTGSRVRCWDSCLNSQFAEVAGGHDFRPTRASRVRHRFYHKFWAYPARYGKTMCVGCGRCYTACKVGINPSRVVAALQGDVGEGEA
ncbi:MAG: 4Fe-4S dicluster domain-containing protein [Coriobacteriia bacterium]|nr:4Fe-4S dicluster domain-containing protein [Coriobacteriia bacterium]